MSYIASWSGGKDSCLAFYKAVLEGYEVSCLVNFVSEEYKRVRFHGTEARMIELQAEAMGIRLLQKETTDDGYEQQFKEAVRSLIVEGVNGMVFGDVYLQDAKQWVERVCDEMGIEAVEPLWGKSAQEVLDEFIEAGFEAIIVGGQARFIEQEWIGRRVDTSFAEYLKNRDICPCGENGEYHTLVIDGPVFNKRIEIVEAVTINREGFWFLDTRKYQLAG